MLRGVAGSLEIAAGPVPSAPGPAPMLRGVAGSLETAAGPAPSAAGTGMSFQARAGFVPAPGVLRAGDRPPASRCSGRITKPPPRRPGPARCRRRRHGRAAPPRSVPGAAGFRSSPMRTSPRSAPGTGRSNRRLSSSRQPPPSRPDRRFGAAPSRRDTGSSSKSKTMRAAAFQGRPRSKKTGRGRPGGVGSRGAPRRRGPRVRGASRTEPGP